MDLSRALAADGRDRTLADLTVADELVVFGFGLPDDGNHAPNERFRLEQFHGATEALLRAFAGYGRRTA